MSRGPGRGEGLALVPAQRALGARGAVVSPHRLASGAGLAILRAGGGAVDAAIATNAALAVVAGHSCGLGGDAFWLIWTPAQKGGGPASTHRAPMSSLRPSGPGTR